MEEKGIDLGFNPMDDIEVEAGAMRNSGANGSIIKVMGVGGGGGNAVKHMYDMGIVGVDFMVCNTDAQALEKSPIPVKIQLGSGLGAGAIPEVAREAALKSEAELQMAMEGAKMLFVTAGMGGGTGTGASPIVASIARGMGILTVGIVTYPFDFEGESKFKVADEGIDELRQNVDALIVIKNELLKIYYPDLTISNAFAKSDDVLLVAAKSIAELITIHGSMNVDFNDVKTILENSGTAIIGAGIAEGENRAREAAEAAIASPLLDQKSIYGAEKGLLFIAYGPDSEPTMEELTEITDCLAEATCNLREKLIW
ncbi:MAG: cell division protein FtsZ, partial [Bacteroidales bacterium]|nr:cell division protein FtsZ [Bacteroidales bacterium]